MGLSKLISLSRPHFWLYEFGTFFLGVILAASTLKEVFSSCGAMGILFSLASKLFNLWN